LPSRASVGLLRTAGVDVVVAPPRSASRSGAPARELAGSENAEATPTSLEQVREVVRGAGYVTFDDDSDGCVYRSILLSAELAVAGIPTNAQLLKADDGAKTIRPTQLPGQAWYFHVVPVVYLGAGPTSDQRHVDVRDGELAGDLPPAAYVVDPALYPEELVVPLRTWVDDLTPPGTDAYLVIDDARNALAAPGRASIRRSVRSVRSEAIGPAATGRSRAGSSAPG
jgi:hypothetical protein